MVSPQGGKSGIRRIVGRITSARAGRDDFGARSCAAFAISMLLFWLLTIVAYAGSTVVGTTLHADPPGLIRGILTVVLLLSSIGAILLGVVFAIVGIGWAIWERRVPIYSIIGIILNVAPIVFFLLLAFFRA